MTTYNWEDVDVPRGAFISWGATVGQFVCGKVLSYDPQGGTDFNNRICPQAVIELIDPAASINKEGVRTDFPAGELVVVKGDKVSLKRAIEAANLNPGDVVKITLSNLVKTANGTVKEFDFKIARGAGGNVKPQGFSSAATTAHAPINTQVTPQAEPPF